MSRLLEVVDPQNKKGFSIEEELQKIAKITKDSQAKI